MTNQSYQVSTFRYTSLNKTIHPFACVLYKNFDKKGYMVKTDIGWQYKGFDLMSTYVCGSG